jgi:hypothetical protein
MSTNIKYQVVQHVDGQLVSNIVEPEHFEAWLQGRGLTVIGHHKSTATRHELQGHPTIYGLCGPLWGGDENGYPLIRYESPEAYTDLSI